MRSGLACESAIADCKASESDARSLIFFRRTRSLEVMVPTNDANRIQRMFARRPSGIFLKAAAPLLVEICKLALTSFARL